MTPRARRSARRFESWQRDAERALLIAYRDVERERVSPRDATTLCERMSVESAESELTLVAAVGMSDPVRVEAPKSVETCRRAGVAVKMVTGILCPPPSPWRDGAAF